ncbi:MAG TPA: shikimate kinase [Bryobacteraceae bacterium]|nr:shikimate kinase [Bryobacteraceae bacterium]
MILKLKRSPGIYVVGFMASGKTTIGRYLADELGWSFADLDDDIESQQGVKIAEIFDTQGEEEFRRIETAILTRRIRMIERGQPTVLALGGGTFAQPANFELMEENGVSVWLDCPFDMVCRRVSVASHRPLARDPEQFRRLFDDRRAAYVRSDYRISIVDDDPMSAVRQILNLPIF